MKKNILLIEDLDAISNSITFNLQKQGYSVLSKKTILTGEDIFSSYKISLIIIDNNLIITSIREKLIIPDNYYHSIPLIVLIDEKRNFIEKKFGGDVTLIVKPFSSAKLLNTIQNILG